MEHDEEISDYSTPTEDATNETEAEETLSQEVESESGEEVVTDVTAKVAPAKAPAKRKASAKKKAPAKATSDRPVVRIKMIGVHAKRVQDLLEKHGYSVGRPAYIDAETRVSIMEFQEDNNLEITGAVDAPTWEVLLS